MPLRTYKVLAGTHFDEKNIAHVAGKPSAIFQSHADLMAHFPQKFAVVNASELPSEAAAPTPDAGKPAPVNKPNDKIESTLGEDVTADFPKAIAADYRVVQLPEGGFQVVEPMAPNTGLSRKKLGTADDVNAYIAKQLGG